MRVAVVTEYFNPGSSGGTPAVLPNLVRHLVDRYPELQIEVITGRNSYRGERLKYPSFEDWNGVRIYRVPGPRSNHPSTTLRLIWGLWFSLTAALKLSGLGSYDLILLGTNPPSAPLVTQLVSQVRRTPYLYLIHDLYPDILLRMGLLAENHPIARLAKNMQKQWLKKSRKVIALGRCMGEHIIAGYGLPAEQVEVITNWGDPQAIHLLSKETRFRKDHNLAGFLVLWAGNFGKYQNFDDLLEAAEVLREQVPAITLVFVGEGAQKNYVTNRAIERGLENIRFYPFVPSEDFPDLLASADVSVVALESNLEGLGVPSKFYNILASGRPTLAILGSHSEVARVLEEHDCGVRVERGHPLQLAEELIRLSRSPDRVSQMGENARKAFLEKYTIDKIAEQYYQVFKEFGLRSPYVG